MTWASDIQLHGGWAVVLTLAVGLTLAPFPTHAITLSYGYDANGNRISGDGKYFEYNDANRLVRVRQGTATGPIVAEFFYDHTGQRIKKIENGVTTYYIGKHFEANQTGYSTINTNYYFAGTERVAKTNTINGSSTLFFYHANHLGSTEAISDASGNLVNRTNYFPFGEIRQGGAEKYSFTGKERDAVSGQYYFEARYYASLFKHFTQADTVVPDVYNPQSLNRYGQPLREQYIRPFG
jgi:RHS repeat-associated protein